MADRRTKAELLALLKTSRELSIERWDQWQETLEREKVASNLLDAAKAANRNLNRKMQESEAALEAAEKAQAVAEAKANERSVQCLHYRDLLREFIRGALYES